MAAQPAVKRAPQSVPVPAKRGRPTGSRNKTAEEKRLSNRVQEIDYSRVKNVFQKPADFYVYVAGYPDKTGLMGTCYRLKPRIDLSLIGIEETAILQTTVEAEMSEEHIASVYGRGLYMFCLTDANRPKGQTEVAKTWFDCSTALKPPQYDPRTLLLGEPKNLDEINRLLNAGVLVRDGATGAPRLRTAADGAAPAPVSPAAPAAPASPFGQIDLGAVLVSLIDRGSRNPHETVKDTIEVARLLSPQLDVETVVERVVSRLGGGARNGGKPEDAFSAYERIDAFVQKVRGPVAPVVDAANAGKNGGSIANAWGPYIPAIFAEARSLLPEVGNLLRELRAERGANGAPPQQNGGQRQVQQRQPVTLEQRIEEIVRLGFQKMNEGVSGFDFAAYVVGFHPNGREVFEFLDPQGTAGLIALAAMNPAARGMVNDPQIRPQLEAFLNDFFSFVPPELATGSEAEPAAPAAAS
jgi:hypothetical protein